MNNAYDPVTKRAVETVVVPKWVEGVGEEKVAWVQRVVVVGSGGSFVDGGGVWREGGRVALRVFRERGQGRWGVEEVFGKEEEDGGGNTGGDRGGQGEGECGVRLVDLLRARMRGFEEGCKDVGGWRWSKEALLEVACLL